MIDKKTLLRIILGALCFVVCWTSELYAEAFYETYPLVKLLIFLIPYCILGYPVLRIAVTNIGHGNFFDENFLMGVATIGALALGEYPEAVAVMLFYQIGEYFQSYAVDKSRASISEMMEIAPETALLEIDGDIEEVDPDEVEVGSTIVVKPGERVPIDGVIVAGETELDTSAITGESLPRNVFIGSEIVSGSINLSSTIRIKTTKEFNDSTVSRILELVEDAASEKAPVENFITRFAHYYTPLVCLAAAIIAFIPPLFTGLNFPDWIQRALIFLVVSCPCALVISIPLSFFGGIGGASRRGILIKGGNHLEMLSKVKTMLFDKTGTITKGVFSVHRIVALKTSEEELLRIAALAESYSNHPIALSIMKAHEKPLDLSLIEDSSEIPGQGVRCIIDGKVVLAGNNRLMEANGIKVQEKLIDSTVLHVAIDNVYQGFIEVRDIVKEDSKEAISRIKAMGVERTVMLTGDREEVAAVIAHEVGIDEFHAGLLPEGKIDYLRAYMEQAGKGSRIAFVGDGINDAPALIRADLGISMGAMGSDAAIEAADIVLMDDKLSRLSEGIELSHLTMRIVYQNIVFALGIKFLILVLAAFGVANMWEAIFADVGVAILAILNAMRTLTTNKVGKTDPAPITANQKQPESQKA